MFCSYTIVPMLCVNTCITNLTKANQEIDNRLLEEKLAYDPVSPSLVGWSVCHIFFKRAGSFTSMLHSEHFFQNVCNYKEYLKKTYRIISNMNMKMSDEEILRIANRWWWLRGYQNKCMLNRERKENNIFFFFRQRNF